MPSQGLEDIVVAQTNISRVEDEIGRLTFRGYDVRDLAGTVSFEEVAYLFWYGELPNCAQLQELQDRLFEARQLPEHVMAVLRALPPSAQPVDALRTIVSALGAGQPLAKPDLPQAIRLTAQIPVLLAAFDRWRRGLEPLASRPDLGTAGNYLYLLKGEIPSPVQARALDTYFVLLADHGLNASTFAARVVASTRSDLYSCITAAIAALKGPLHGGAPSRVLDMFHAIGTWENAAPWMRSALSQHERLMGFGHRMYKTPDPRAEILRDVARRVSSPDNFALAQEVERLGTRLLQASRPDQPMYPNVEFYGAVVLDAVGLPKDLFTATFAVSRASGWTAHVLEQAQVNQIIRPRAEYIGPEPHPVKPLEQRS